MIKNEGSIFIKKLTRKQRHFFGKPTLTTNHHPNPNHHLTHELMNQFPVTTASKSLGEEC